MSLVSRLNPKAGIVDFWHEFRKPNPLRLPILLVSTIPLMIVFYWLSGEVHYKVPARPQITYITTFDPNRTDAEIMASNEAAQEVKELRQAAADDLAERKRNTYKTLGAAIGMDVDSIAERADAERAAEEAKAAEERAAILSRAQKDGPSEPSDPASEGDAP